MAREVQAQAGRCSAHGAVEATREVPELGFPLGHGRAAEQSAPTGHLQGRRARLRLPLGSVPRPGPPPPGAGANACPATAVLVSYELPTVAYLAYPLRRPRPPHSSFPSPASDPLTLILGPARAAALRALRRPLTVSQLATAIGCAPTTATYHIQHLVAAGLATRQRRGPSVQISRTLRGTELVDLLST
jgi:DNA-binding transcriptional ArsR family regulator